MLGLFNKVLSRITTRSAKTSYLSRQPYLGMIGGASSLTGVDVTPASAMSLSAVFAAVQGIAYDVAAFPLLAYRHLPQGGKVRVDEHPVAQLLRNPNPEMVEFDARAAVMVGALLYGNGYAEIVRRGDGRAAELWPIESYRVNPMRDGSGTLYYQVDGAQLRADQVFHVKGLSTTGVVGLLTTQTAKETFGMALAAARFASAYYGNGARPGGVITHPGKLTAEAAAKLRDQWAAVHGGVDNQFKTAVLEEGSKWEAEGVDPEQSQLLESRQWSVVEIARYFNVSPLRLGELGRATWSNLEESNSQYIQQTLTPWCRKIEQTAQKQLFLPSERDLFAEHNMDALLRGKTSERFVAYGQAINAGWMTRNEVRAKENLPPLEGLDTPVMQGAMVPVVAETPLDPTDPLALPAPEKPADPPEQDPATEQDDKDRQARTLLMAQLPLLAGEVRRLLRVEQDKMVRALKRGDAAFVDTFYPAHRKVVESSLGPVIRSMAATVETLGVTPDASVLSRAAERHVRESRSDLDSMEGVEAADIVQRVEGWDARADGFAESVVEELLGKAKV